MNLQIDPEFKSLIPPLTYTEREQLEANVLADGCLDSLKTWSGILLDGHNRYEICTAHDLPYLTEEIRLDSREDAVIWICKNQMGRRNITDEQRNYLIGVRYRSEKKLAGQHSGNQYTPLETGQNVHIPNRREQRNGTAGSIGGEYGVDGRTVRRAEKFAQGIDIIGQADPALKSEILAGKRNVVKQDISNIVQLPAPQRTAAIEKIRRGERTTLPKASFTAEELFPETTTKRTVDDVVREIVNTSKEFMRTLDAIIDRNRDSIDTDQQKVSDAITDAAKQMIERTEMFK
jgi:hypothetical protein